MSWTNVTDTTYFTNYADSGTNYYSWTGTLWQANHSVVGIFAGLLSPTPTCVALSASASALRITFQCDVGGGCGFGNFVSYGYGSGAQLLGGFSDTDPSLGATNPTTNQMFIETVATYAPFSVANSPTNGIGAIIRDSGNCTNPYASILAIELFVGTSVFWKNFINSEEL